VGTEGPPPRLLREDGEFLSSIRVPGKLAENHRLRHPVELNRRVATGTHGEGSATSLRAREWQHRAAHALADAREDLEPVAGFQLGASVELGSVETLRRRRRRRSTTIDRKSTRLNSSHVAIS